jgi:hypothetical protein
MKTFSQFIAEGIEDAKNAWEKWLSSPAGKAAAAGGGRFDKKVKNPRTGQLEVDNSEVSKAAKEFMKTYQKTGKPPEWASSSSSTQSPPRSQQPAGGQKPPAQSNVSSTQKPQANWKSAAGTGLRRGVAGLGAVGHAAAGEYPEAGIVAAMGSRRLSKAIPQVGRIAVQKAAASAGQRTAGKIASRFVPGLQQAYGITMGTRALAKGDKLGAALGYASAIPGPIGWGAASLDVAREFVPASTKQTIKDKTGITRLQQSKELERKAIQSGQGLRGIEKGRQTMATRDARQVAAKSGTYGTKQGSALTGIGGATTVNKQAGTLTSKGKTVKLAATQLVRDPKTGQQRVGDLAYKGGKAVYLARPSVASRDTSLAANIGRALNIGKYSKAAEQKAAKQEYRTALRNTQAYTRGLGVSTQSATRQGLPGYGTKPAAKPAVKPAPKPKRSKADIIAGR